MGVNGWMNALLLQAFAEWDKRFFVVRCKGVELWSCNLKLNVSWYLNCLFYTAKRGLKNCDTLISPKCPAGEPNSINSGFAPNEKPQLPYWVLGAKENYAWGIARMCEVPLREWTDLSTCWSAKVSATNGKTKVLLFSRFYQLKETLKRVQGWRWLLAFVL